MMQTPINTNIVCLIRSIHLYATWNTHNTPVNRFSIFLRLIRVCLRYSGVIGRQKIINEMARAIVLTSEQWFLLSGTENTDGGLITNLKL
jgi:hypothetical protein